MKILLIINAIGFLISLITMFLFNYSEYKNGRDMTLFDLLISLACIIFWPLGILVMFIMLIDMFRNWLERFSYKLDIVVIKGKNNERN